MAKKMDAVLTRCDGVPPEVNVSQNAQHNNQDSEFSSVIGDPSQTAQSDTSKTISQVSSAGKRSIAATQAPSTTPTEVIPTSRRSPIKKKQRAQGSLHTQQSDSTDEENESEASININLEERFHDTTRDDTATERMQYQHRISSHDGNRSGQSGQTHQN